MGSGHPTAVIKQRERIPAFAHTLPAPALKGACRACNHYALRRPPAYSWGALGSRDSPIRWVDL